MPEVTRPSSVTRLRFRYQLLGGFFLAALLPYIVRITMFNDALLLADLNQTLFANTIAVLFGAWLFRSVNGYPGFESSAYVLPSFSISYSLVLLVLVFGRIGYNRIVLVAGFFLSLSWFYFVYFRLQRKLLRIGLIPGGAVSSLRGHGNVIWKNLPSPSVSVEGLDAIAVDLRVDLPIEWERRLADYALTGIPVYHCKHLLESLTGRVELEHLSENSFGSLSPASVFMTVKHSVDWLIALAALVLLGPFLLVLIFIIRLNSPGPGIFKQTRIGYRGRPFTVYKLRTMRTLPAGGTEARESAITRDADARVTNIGRILRRMRIDELTQLFNVLKGEMSWIGPRPEAEVLSCWYESEIPFYRYRHIVRPGLTGWAQVNQGHVAEVEEVISKLHYDFFYVKNYSPWLDLLIILRTAKTILSGFGAR